MESHRGYFFLPEYPEKEIFGFLYIEENGKTYVELMNSITNSFFNDRDQTKTILGLLNDGRKVTLLNCRQGESVYRFGVSATEKFYIDLALIGCHITDRNSKHFNTISARLDLLDSWINQNGGEFETTLNFKKFCYRYQQPPEISFQISELLRGSFYFQNNVDFKKNGFESIQLTRANIESNVKVSIDELIVALRSFRKFYAIIIGQKVNVTSIIITSPDEVIKVINPSKNHIPHTQPINVIYNDIDTNLRITESQRPLISYTAIAEQMQTLINNWFEDVEKRLMPITNILLEAISNKLVFDENEFLNVFQAVEAFDRIVNQNTEILIREHEIKMQSIIDEIQDKDTSLWLLDALRFKYEPSASKRLKRMLKENKEILNLKLNSASLGKWVNEMVESRNYLTHFDPKSAEKKVSSEKLYHYTNLLKGLLSVSIFKLLGISDKIIKTVNELDHFNLRRLQNNKTRTN